MQGGTESQGRQLESLCDPAGKPSVPTRRELGENPSQPPVQQMEKLSLRRGGSAGRYSE